MRSASFMSNPCLNASSHLIPLRRFKRSLPDKPTLIFILRVAAGQNWNFAFGSRSDLSAPEGHFRSAPDNRQPEAGPARAFCYQNATYPR